MRMEFTGDAEMWLRLTAVVEAVNALHHILQFSRDTDRTDAPAIGTVRMVEIAERRLKRRRKPADRAGQFDRLCQRFHLIDSQRIMRGKILQRAALARTNTGKQRISWDVCRRFDVQGDAYRVRRSRWPGFNRAWFDAAVTIGQIDVIVE